MEPEDIAQRFRILRKCQNNCLIFELFFYQRTETNTKQTVRFGSRQTICLEQLIRAAIILFFSIVYIFNTFLPIVSFFSARHIFIDFNLF